jgi:hypothetical protein
VTPLAGLRVGYSPYTPTLTHPGDRRRFVFYARQRGIEFELADPSREYDVVVLSERADIVTWARRGPETRIVYDLIDGYLGIAPTDWKARGRGLAKFLVRETRRPALDYRAAIERMCRRADCVVCTSPLQRDDIGGLSDNVQVILDAHFDLVSDVKQSYTAVDGPNLVWEGLPENVGSLTPVASALRQTQSADTAVAHLVTDLWFHRYLSRVWRRSSVTLARRLFPRVYLYEWNPRMLSAIVTACDLAVLPLDVSDPFLARKPENKLLLFWRMGVPVLASPSPAHEQAMESAGVDMLCRTPEEWVAKLDRYLVDEDERRAAGEQARRYVEATHTEERLLAAWDAVFESVALD